LKTARVAGLGCVFAMLVTVAAHAQIPTFINLWGSLGSGPGQFSYPYGGTVAPDGTVLITDQYNFRIQAFGPTGEFIRSWGSAGSGPGQFGIQIGITTDQQGKIYVADYGNARVQVFSPTGAFLRQFANGMQITDVAIGPDGLIYATGRSSTGNDSARVNVYDETGVLRKRFGGFLQAVSLAFAPDGTVWVADGGMASQALYQFDPVSGARLARFPRLTIDPSFVSFGGLCVASSGVLYLCDFDGARVYMFMPSIGVIGTFAGQFCTAVDIALAPNGDFYVVDLRCNRIVHMGPGATPVRKESWGAVKVAYR